MPSDSPSQSVSSAISGRRSTIALFIPGIPTNPLRIHSLSSSLSCYWSTCNQYRSKRIVFMKQQALLILTVVTSFRPCFCMSKPRMPSDSPSQSVSSAISGRRSTIALFIPGIPTNPLRIHSLSSSLPCYWSTYNQYRSKRIVFMTQQVTSFRPYFCMSIAKNFLRQPVAISLISNQWKEKYNCAFHPRHSNQSTQNPLTLFKLIMLLVYLQSISLQENCVHDSEFLTSTSVSVPISACQ